jgi:hypothetical protein
LDEIRVLTPYVGVQSFLVDVTVNSLVKQTKTGNHMRKFIAMALFLVGCLASAVQAAISMALPDRRTDDKVTLLYDPSLGAFSLDHPTGLEAIIALDIKSSSEIFTGPEPTNVLSGLCDLWVPRRCFKVGVAGFSSIDFGAGSVAKGLSSDQVSSMLSANGSFVDGTSLRRSGNRIDLFVVPRTVVDGPAGRWWNVTISSQAKSPVLGKIYRLA